MQKIKVSLKRSITVFSILLGSMITSSCQEDLPYDIDDCLEHGYGCIYYQGLAHVLTCSDSRLKSDITCTEGEVCKMADSAGYSCSAKPDNICPDYENRELCLVDSRKHVNMVTCEAGKVVEQLDCSSHYGDKTEGYCVQYYLMNFSKAACAPSLPIENDVTDN